MKNISRSFSIFPQRRQHTVEQVHWVFVIGVGYFLPDQKLTHLALWFWFFFGQNLQKSILEDVLGLFILLLLKLKIFVEYHFNHTFLRSLHHFFILKYYFPNRLMSFLLLLSTWNNIYCFKQFRLDFFLLKAKLQCNFRFLDFGWCFV